MCRRGAIIMGMIGIDGSSFYETQTEEVCYLANHQTLNKCKLDLTGEISIR